jgi:hypothetical protein
MLDWLGGQFDPAHTGASGVALLSGRALDLDLTYKYIIKPAVMAAGLEWF